MYALPFSDNSQFQFCCPLIHSHNYPCFVIPLTLFTLYTPSISLHTEGLPFTWLHKETGTSIRCACSSFLSQLHFCCPLIHSHNYPCFVIPLTLFTLYTPSISLHTEGLPFTWLHKETGTSIRCACSSFLSQLHFCCPLIHSHNYPCFVIPLTLFTLYIPSISLHTEGLPFTGLHKDTGTSIRCVCSSFLSQLHSCCPLIHSHNYPHFVIPLTVFTL